MKRLDKGFRKFFKGAGFPRFKGRNRYNTFTYPQKGFELENGKINLSKIGSIRIFKHRKIEGRIKTCTIKKDIDQWCVIFTVEIEKHVQQTPVETMVGVDVGLKSLITLGDGMQLKPPEFLKTSENKLVQEQKRLSRKKNDSANRNKQRTRIAKVHRKIRNQRTDFAHKTSQTLVNSYDLVVFENLNIQGMVQNHHLAKSISDAGWYQLQTFTKYKAEEAGKHCEFVVPNGTSQICHVCGNKETLTLADRVFRCSRCVQTEISMPQSISEIEQIRLYLRMAGN